MRLSAVVAVLFVITATPSFSQVPPQVEECRKVGLAALKQRSPSLDQITLDMDLDSNFEGRHSSRGNPHQDDNHGGGLSCSDKTDKPNRFLCLLSSGGKVVLTFFTEQ